jgi:hypothetical protein
LQTLALIDRWISLPFAGQSGYVGRVGKGIKPGKTKPMILLIIIIAVGVALGIGAIRRLDNNPKPKREFYFRYGKRAAEIKAERTAKQTRE